MADLPPFHFAVSYDICKNNEPVAKVILLRNTYRLGETITGIVNFSHSRIPCYQVKKISSVMIFNSHPYPHLLFLSHPQISAYLENSENIESVYSIRSKQQTTKQTRKIVAEQHRNVLNARRTNISLTIPLSGTPEFQTTAGIKTNMPKEGRNVLSVLMNRQSILLLSIRHIKCISSGVFV